jgi:TPR repeat protein
MNMRVITSAVAAVIAFACAPQATGYDASDPTKLTCPCDDPQTCYESAARLDEQGETAETGEQLLELAQCACLEGSFAGCNTLAHFAKDWVAACERGDDVARSCTIAGFVHEHAARVPEGSGKTFHRDPVAARTAFDKACQAGSAVACRHGAR